jgi:general secretion pathway protein G
MQTRTGQWRAMFNVVAASRQPLAASRAGFTLMEVMVVLLVLGMLAGFAAPVISNSLGQARESALKENLHVLRQAIDDYYADKGSYPSTLAELVKERYLRKIPADPVLEPGETNDWHLEYAEEGGIRDLRSSSGKTARDGSRYDQW